MSHRKHQEVYALAGTCASGKTTIFETLRSQDLPNVAFVPEAARLYYQEHDVPKAERSGYPNQIRIQTKFIQLLQTALAEQKPYVLTDCSPLSSVYYSLLGGNTEQAWRLAENIRPFLPLYTLFLLLDPNDIDYCFDPTSPVRRETEEERFRVHELILEVFQALAVPYLSVSGSVAERVSRIKGFFR